MMPTLQTNLYELDFYDDYVVIMMKENQHLTLSVAKEIRPLLIQRFDQKSFVIINYRKFSHQVSPEVYCRDFFKNIRGIAIVSNNVTDKTIAAQEQLLFDQSFAFFTSLETAKSWVQTLS